MKTKLTLALALLTLAAAAGLRAQPYITASTGTARIDAADYGTQSRRRDALALGYLFTDFLGAEASYFSIQEARYPLAAPSGGPAIPTTLAVRQKLKGYTLGAVLRWNAFPGFTVFTRQALAFSQTDLVAEQAASTVGRNYRNGSYQPSLGVSFRPFKGVPFSVGAEYIYVSMSSARIKSTVLNASFGF